MLNKILKLFSFGLSVTPEPIITVNEREIICEFSSQNKTDKISWDDVDTINVLTTDEGPFTSDVFILLVNSKTNLGVALPSDRDETQQVIEKILQFPNFDFEKWITSMGSVENCIFEVWKKDQTV